MFLGYSCCGKQLLMIVAGIVDCVLLVDVLG